MSAITRIQDATGRGGDYAYNLFTGVDRAYRGRKLAQAVKVLALRYARDVLRVDTVRTHHNAKNAPMIAIDRKLGYVQQPGTYLMEKTLDLRPWQARKLPWVRRCCGGWCNDHGNHIRETAIGYEYPPDGGKVPVLDAYDGCQLGCPYCFQWE